MTRSAPSRHLTILLVGLTALILCGCERATTPDTAPSPVESSAKPESATKEGSTRTQGDVAPEREEIRYIITVLPPSMAKAGARLESLLQRLDIPHAESIRTDGDNRLAIPREQYLEFIERLAKHGRLRVERERFNTPEPSDSPIPFVIRFFGDSTESAQPDEDI